MNKAIEAGLWERGFVSPWHICSHITRRSLFLIARVILLSMTEDKNVFSKIKVIFRWNYPARIFDMPELFIQMGDFFCMKPFDKTSRKICEK